MSFVQNQDTKLDYFHKGNKLKFYLRNNHNPTAKGSSLKWGTFKWH